MQTESGENAVGAPMGAPTCPPCVALRAGKSQSGAQAPVDGSQPLGSGPHASTVPPPVTRQPPMHSAGVGVIATHWPVSGLHSWQVGLLHVIGVKTQPSPGAVGTQVSVVQLLLSLHGACGVKTQPSPGAVGTQVSFVQLLLSSQGACGVKTQPSPGAVGTQVSVVQLLLSSHGACGVKTQASAVDPAFESQVSVVQL